MSSLDKRFLCGCGYVKGGGLVKTKLRTQIHRVEGLKHPFSGGT